MSEGVAWVKQPPYSLELNLIDRYILKNSETLFEAKQSVDFEIYHPQSVFSEAKQIDDILFCQVFTDRVNTTDQLAQYYVWYPFEHLRT